MWPFPPKVGIAENKPVRHYAPSKPPDLKFSNKKYQSSGIKRQHPSKYSISTLRPENHIFCHPPYPGEFYQVHWVVQVHNNLEPWHPNQSQTNESASTCLCEWYKEFSKPEEVHAGPISSTMFFSTIMTPLKTSTICKGAWDSWSQRKEQQANWTSLQNHSAHYGLY